MFSDKIQFLPTLGGKTIVMYQNYTFSYVNGKRCLRCSRKLTMKCDARLTLDAQGNIVSALTKHNHPPPKFHRTSEGLYIKLQ
ncbi:unnamed protein product [Parnassius mnemosyne]|uniref:FLYWCH-type domain-containing protein n=1 Tax=Parnassius mnemosyne TaxID=213953 RepID=A0AAV1KBQ8_9NEOP